ncbi:ATP-binding protein [Corynebacterium heidelbergense]|uniref:ATP-binding protein n=1 Tax=Corynebacterium heidelbergense TaxID=2055947 RepID=A0A364V7H0_9CORY|nr:ATP-binding protein [Corynebacterium heidelbergense]RAV32554.1 ATP-binding protein [Corynebacterium heidelbergense]
MPTPRNPFRPSFGTSPYYLAGRSDLLQHFQLSLLEGPGSPYRTILISGLRGVGKTVLLNEVEDIAHKQGWIILRAYPNQEMIADLVNTTVPQAIATIEQPPQRRLSGGSIPGLGSIKTETHDRAEELRPTPTLITRLRDLSTSIADVGILITLDELQSADLDQLHQLATAVQDLMRDERDIAFVCAGLPRGVDELLQHEGTTFLRRAHRVDLHAVSPEDVRETLDITAKESGVPFTPPALDLATDICRGYPYLIQLVGSLSWAQAALEEAPHIDAAQVEAINQPAIDRMTQQVHRPALSRVPDGELSFLRAMAELMAASGEKSVSTGEIAAALGMKSPNGISTRRSRLITRDLIAPAGFGKVAFTLPYLEEYLLREG